MYNCAKCSFSSEFHFSLIVHEKFSHPRNSRREPFHCCDSYIEKRLCYEWDYETHLKVDYNNHTRRGHDWHREEFLYEFHADIETFEKKCKNCDFQTFSTCLLFIHEHSGRGDAKCMVDGQLFLTQENTTKNKSVGLEDESLPVNEIRELDVASDKSETADELPSLLSPSHHSRIRQDDETRLESDAVFAIVDESANLKTNRILHKGTFVINCHQIGNCLFGFINNKVNTLCQCEYSSDDTLRAHYTRSSGSERVSLKLDFCLPQAQLSGKVIEIGSITFGQLAGVSSGQSKERKEKRRRSKESKEKRSKCLYCSKFVLSRGLTDHLKRIHKNEQDVKSALRFPTKSRDRIAALQKIKNMGNRSHDTSVALGSRIHRRQPIVSEPSKSLTCPNCYGLFVASNYARHYRKCYGLPAGTIRATTEARMSQLLASNRKGPTEPLKRNIDNVLGRFKDVKAVHTIKSDKALLALLKVHCLKGHSNLSRARNLRSQLLLLLKLLKYIQELDPAVREYEDVLKGSRYDLILLAVVKYIGLNPSTGEIKKPSILLLLRSCLDNLASALCNSYNKSDCDDYEKKRKALLHFKVVHRNRYAEAISAHTEEYNSKFSLPTKKEEKIKNNKLISRI